MESKRKKERKKEKGDGNDASLHSVMLDSAPSSRRSPSIRRYRARRTVGCDFPGKSLNGTSYSRVSADERTSLFSLDSRQQGKIDMLRKNLFHCERLQSRGVKPENSAGKACFHFLHFSMEIIKLFQLWAPRARTNSKKTDLTKKVSSSTGGTRLVPRGAVESLTV